MPNGLALSLIIRLAVECGADALAVSLDSELVVRQFNGTHEIKDQLEIVFRNLAQKAAQRLSEPVVLNCAGQGDNEEARALAERAASTPKLYGIRGGMGSTPWTPTTSNNSTEWPDDPAAGEFGHDEPNLGRLRKLRVAGGHDAYSSMRDTKLREVVDKKWGKESLVWMLSALGWSSRKHYGRIALRWAVRGLAPPVALKKASLDTEVTRAQAERNMRDHYREWMKS